MREAVPAVAGRSSRALPVPKRVAVFLPGLFGSTLRNRTGAGATDIWSRNFCQLNDALVNNYNLLLSPATETGVLDKAVVQIFGRPVYSRSYHQALLAMLESHDDFRQRGQLLIFSYDWRRSLPLLLNVLRKELSNQFGMSYDSNGRARKQTEHEFYLIGHSLGAVLLMVAVSSGAIHPDNIGNLILIAPPLKGSATAFRALFDGFPLPVVSDVKNAFCFSWSKNRKIAEENLHNTLRQLPAGYLLMPPSSELFVRVGPAPAPFVSPLKSGVFRGKLTKHARAMHRDIAKSVSKIPLPQVRVHVLHGTGVPTDQKYQVRQTVNRAGQNDYEMAVVLPQADGDGTVTTLSALYNGQMQPKSKQYAFTVAEHGTICEQKAVLNVIRTLL
jgi:pimeloyl-ACP methyl ester carboxylesterase